MTSIPEAVVGHSHKPVFLGCRKPLNRRFIIVEGVYAGSGDIAPMDEIFKLKEEFCHRLVVDESSALGVLGQHGRGACEHFGLQPQQVEIVTATMGKGVASMYLVCNGFLPCHKAATWERSVFVANRLSLALLRI